MGKQCKNCQEVKPLDNFHNATGGYKQAICKPCEMAYHRRWYRANKTKVKHQVRARAKRVIEENQGFLTEHLQAHPCTDCGEDDWTILEFDHLPQHPKSFGVSAGLDRSRESLKAEIAKCEVVCPTCHVRRTRQRAPGWRQRARLQETAYAARSASGSELRRHGTSTCETARAVNSPPRSGSWKTT